MGQNEPTASQRELRERLINEWPEHGTDLAEGYFIPPVRQGGRTEMLIDLAVQLAEEIYGDRIDNILAEVGERAERDAYEGD